MNRLVNRYIANRTLVAVFGLLGALSGLAFTADFVENLRFAGKFDGDAGFALALTALRTPGLVQAMLPFVFLFGAISMFWQLNRRSELAVLRSAGLSIWSLIAPAALVAAVFGLLTIALLDPLAARMMRLSEDMSAELSGKSANLVRVFGDAVWLRQRDEGATLIIKAGSLDAATGALTDVTIWRLRSDATFEERIDAPRAVLSGRMIELEEARTRSDGEQLPRRTPRYMVPTRLTSSDLKEGAPPPETLSVWALPRFMVMAQSAGLSTVPYEMRFHDLCSTPLKLVAMVLIAAVFAMRPLRSGGTARLLLAAIGSGFGLYILAALSAALGESGTAPVALAAWAPAIVTMLAAGSFLLRAEEA